MSRVEIGVNEKCTDFEGLSKVKIQGGEQQEKNIESNMGMQREI